MQAWQSGRANIDTAETETIAAHRGSVTKSEPTEPTDPWRIIGWMIVWVSVLFFTLMLAWGFSIVLASQS